MNGLKDTYREVPLGSGKSAIVDADDFDWVMQYSWHFRPSSLTGYARATPSFSGKMFHFYLHRLVLRARPHENIDHINRDGLDNRKANLRFCSLSQNMINRISNPNKYGYRGIGKVDDKFRATVRLGGVSKIGARRNTPIEAAMDYDSLARDLHGEFAILNFPDGA